jgi:hypothetical protein
MNAVHKYILLSALMMPFHALAQGKPETPHHRWQVGDKWEVATTLYDRDWMLSFSDPVKEKEKHRARVLAQYTVTFEVTAKVSHQGVDCWQVDLATDEKAPVGVRELKCRIVVSTANGSMRESEEVVSPQADARVHLHRWPRSDPSKR